jgi:hypothetical protein
MSDFVFTVPSNSKFDCAERDPQYTASGPRSGPLGPTLYLTESWVIEHCRKRSFNCLSSACPDWAFCFEGEEEEEEEEGEEQDGDDDTSSF